MPPFLIAFKVKLPHTHSRIWFASESDEVLEQSGQIGQNDVKENPCGHSNDGPDRGFGYACFCS